MTHQIHNKEYKLWKLKFWGYKRASKDKNFPRNTQVQSWIGRESVNVMIAN